MLSRCKYRTTYTIHVVPRHVEVYNCVILYNLEGDRSISKNLVNLDPQPLTFFLKETSSNR